ncbi:UNVERIFIED_CONTAM: hypothetical protein RMT77_003454 [Armadillidium vulgare]
MEMCSIKYFSKIIIIIMLSKFYFQVESIIFQDEIAGAKFKSINDGVIVPMEYHPYPESEPFYTDVVPEIQKAANRSKRTITIAWPYGPPNALIISDFYINIEARNPGYVHAPLSLEVRIHQRFPNLTLFEKNRSFNDRLNIFDTIEKVIESFGISGRWCLLRAICERSEYYVITDGLFSEIVSLLLSVGSSYEGLESRSYKEAFEHGRQFGDCGNKYSECPFSLFKWLKS